MKIRNGYVSNSSSSSFIIDKDLSDKGISCVELNKAQKELINGYETFEGKLNIDINSHVYLTQFISDCYDNKLNEIEKTLHVFYNEGQMNEEPRDIEYYNEYTCKEGKSVYLLKQHDIAKQMTFNDFVKNYKKSNLPNQFIVKYTDDGVILKYIK